MHITKTLVPKTYTNNTRILVCYQHTKSTLKEIRYMKLIEEYR